MSWRANSLLLGLALLASCSSDAHEECSVKGVVVDVQDGEPLVGVRVEGPDGTKAVSDPRGRFVLGGLSEGSTGKVRAWRSDGWEVEVPLRPLQPGSLEVTLRLAPGSTPAHASEGEAGS